MAPDFFPQCCDASIYLNNAFFCVSKGECYDALRPMGGLWWFTLPFLLGIAPGWMILLHALLVVLSAGLASLWLWRQQPGLTPWQKAAALLAVVTAHGVFFWPVLPYSLLDAPAGALFLCGLWLLMLADMQARWRYYLAAGLCLGLAPWLRAAYLYPVLVAVTVLAAVTVLRRQSCRQHLGLLVLAIPLLVQYGVVWDKTGHWSFIDAQLHRKMVSIHLTDPVRGYDTVMGKGAKRWPSACWPAGKAHPQTLADYAPGELACLVADKARFYLGSYAPRSYLGSTAAVDHLHTYWHRSALRERDLAVIHQDAGTTGLRVTAPAPLGSGSLVGPSSAVLNPGSYTFHVTLWANAPRSIHLFLLSWSDKRVITHQPVLLDTVPRQFSLQGTLPATDFMQVRIGSFQDLPMTFGTTASDVLWYRDARLLRDGDDPATTGTIQRSWSTAWLMANVLLIVLAFSYCVRRKPWQQPGHGLALLASTLVFAQALLIVPEQRFVIAPMVMAWVLAAAAVLAWRRRQSLH